MSLNDDIRLLSEVPLFQQLDHDQLRLLAFGAERRVLATGQELFREGSPAEAAFVVSQGSFELLVTDRNGVVRREGLAAPATLLSELALVTMVERKFTAIALEDSEVLRISRSLFHRLLEEYPQVGQMVENRIRDNIVAMANAAAGLQSRFN
jgi:CRP-like cAMP-binding protein